MALFHGLLCTAQTGPVSLVKPVLQHDGISLVDPGAACRASAAHAEHGKDQGIPFKQGSANRQWPKDGTSVF